MDIGPLYIDSGRVFANPVGSQVHPAAVYDNGTRRNTDRASGGGCC
jgi:hypothetical protein